MTTATDITSLKARCTALEARCKALETKDTSLAAAATLLTARVAKLEAVKPVDYAAQFAALQKEVDELRYIISPTPVTPPANVYNVMDYGALHNNSHDDAANIKQAMDACYAAGGGTVYMPAGTYLVNANYSMTDPNGDDPFSCHVPVRQGCTLAGDGMHSTIIHASDASPSGTNIVGVIASNGFTVRDLSTTMNSDYTSGTSKDGLKIMNSDNGTVTNCYFEYNYIGCNCIGNRDITFNNCEAYGCRLGFSTDNNHFGPYWGTNRITFNDCVSSHNSQAGFYAYYFPDSGIGETWTNMPESQRVQNIRYNRCNAHDNGNPGFFSSWSSRTTWVDCTSNNNSGGFYGKYAKDYWMQGCSASGNGYYGNTTATCYDDGGCNKRASL